MTAVIYDDPTDTSSQPAPAAKPRAKRKPKALAIVPAATSVTSITESAQSSKAEIVLKEDELAAARLGVKSAEALAALDKRQRSPVAIPTKDLVLDTLHKRKLTYVGPLNLAGKRIPAETIKKMLTYLPPDTSVQDVINSQNHFLASAVWRGPQNLLVMATVDETPRYGPLLHVSISYPKRNPAWAEIKAIRYALFPRWMDVSMMLPADEDYINLHNYCFQLHQTPERWLMR